MAKTSTERTVTMPDGTTRIYNIPAGHPALTATHAVVGTKSAHFFPNAAAAATFAASKGGVVATVADTVVPKFAKGERVSFLRTSGPETGAKVVGIVQGQRLARVTVRTPTAEFSVHAADLTREGAVALPDAGRMSKYSVKSYKHAAFASEETDCFEAIIAVDGKPYIRMANDGHGGPDHVDCYAPARRGDMDGTLAAIGVARGFRDQFTADCKAWAADNGYDLDEYCEVEGMWLSWEREHRPLGVTAAQYWAEEKRVRDGYRAQYEKNHGKPTPVDG